MGTVEVSIGGIGHIPLIGDIVYINKLDEGSYPKFDRENFVDGDECEIQHIRYYSTMNERGLVVRKVANIKFKHVKTGVIENYNDFHLRTSRDYNDA